MRRWPRPSFIRTGSPASRSARSTRALIAGNAPERRVEQLRILGTDHRLAAWAFDRHRLAPPSRLRYRRARWSNQLSAAMALLQARPASSRRACRHRGCIRAGSVEATSYYDTAPLQADARAPRRFRPHQRGAMRFSVGAVNVRTGNFVYFDTETHHDRPGACHGQRRAAARLSRDRDRRRALLGWRPGFQHAAAMGGRYGRARTRSPSRSICGARAAIFRATWPKSGSRQKEIQYSSRTRANTDRLQEHAKNPPRPLRHSCRGAPEVFARPTEAEMLSRVRQPQGLQRRATDLSREALRRRLEGLRVLAPQHGGALACRLPDAVRTLAHILKSSSRPITTRASSDLSILRTMTP